MKKDELFAMLTSQLGASAPDGDLIGDVFTGEIGIALADIESAMMGGDPSLVAGLGGRAGAAGTAVGAVAGAGAGAVAGALDAASGEARAERDRAAAAVGVNA